VGSDQENPTEINCMDWHDDDVRNIPWNQRQIAASPPANGYWMIEAERPGRYEFTLRQQPAVASFRIRGVRARIKVGDQEAAAEIPPGATGVTLTLTLPAGPAKMQTWFVDEKAADLRGAFFVTARYVN
jgi:hypothetical protein